MTAVPEREYLELLRKHPPHAIRTKIAYGKAMREVEALAIRGDELSRAETDYYRLLCALIGDYERSKGADQWPSVGSSEALRELMELQGVTQSEVAHALGDRAAASAILSGRRQISKSQAKKLAVLFRVDAGVFI